MARLNVPAKAIVTHEGGRAVHTSPENELRRSVLACMLWEDTFYEDGTAIADRITNLGGRVQLDKVLELAVEAREKFHLRHAPLWLLLAAIAQPVKSRPKDGISIRRAVNRTIQRVDEMAEILAMYWKDGKKALPKALQRGIADAFAGFDEYQFAKYKGEGDKITLRDVMFLVHPKPVGEEREALYKRIAERALKTPDTWETAISGTKGETGQVKAQWTRLLAEGRLGGLAVLRNLRNMVQAGVEVELIRKGIKEAPVKRVLPFRFLAAAQAAQQFEDEIEVLMLKGLERFERLQGETALLLDVSGSMTWGTLSGKSTMKPVDVAMGLGILVREVCEHARVFVFSNDCYELPNRRGFGLIDAAKAVPGFGRGTQLGSALDGLLKVGAGKDRVIVLTDEQTHDRVTYPNWSKKGYMVNVWAYQNGVGYGGGWTHIDGWSERVVDYIREVER